MFGKACTGSFWRKRSQKPKESILRNLRKSGGESLSWLKVSRSVTGCEKRDYVLEISDCADKKFEKLAGKNRKQLEIINKKILQILENPYHFKTLRGDMYGARRVHIDKSFVLTYEINEKEKVIRILDYDHHHKIQRILR